MFNKKLKKQTKVILSLLFIGFLAACSSNAAPTPVPTPISVQLQWTHQAQFAGLYAADRNGSYRDEGLAVTFIEGGPTVDNLASIVNGSAQFGIGTAEQVIIARYEGKPLRCIAITYQRSPTVFFTLASSGITRPQDFVGKEIRSVATITSTLHAMTTKVGITPDQYKEVSLPSDIALFAAGEVPIWGAYITNMPVMAQQAGLKINIIYPDDYGVHFYGDCIITTDALIATDPGLVLRFLRASLKGWTFAFENPSKIGEMIQTYLPNSDPVLENAKMLVSLPLINIGQDHIGWMKVETWSGMEQTLREEKVLTKPLDIRQVYTLQFLDQIYGK
jgi:ABC-type nitrate/sulfonate/bicarbonate transport system substrate-binding protein